MCEIVELPNLINQKSEVLFYSIYRCVNNEE